MEVVEDCMLLSGHGHRAIPLDTLVSLTAAEALVLQIDSSDLRETV